MSSDRQLFVRNLPYQATDEDFTQAFSAYGNVKRAFVVRDSVTKISRGFGYVTFTSPEEAQTARNSHVEVLGRMVHCKPADKKSRDSEGKPAKEKSEPSNAEDKPPPKHSLFDGLEGDIAPASTSDYKRCIQIKIAEPSLYEALKMGVLSKLASSKLLSRVQVPQKNSDGKSFIVIECPTRAAAVDCYTQLKEFRENESVKFSFSYLEKKPTKSISSEKITEKTTLPDKLEKVKVEKEEPTEMLEARDIKQFRLIVRNLPFSYTEESLKKMFSSFGNILEIVVPKKDGKFRGFAFVQFSVRTEAEKALKKVNMTEIGGRTVAVDWAVPKSVYERNAPELQNCPASNEDNKMEADGSVSGNESLENDENESSVEELVTVKKEPVVSKKPPPSHDIGEGRTVFVRGLAFSTDEVELMATFEKLFGEIFYAKICQNETGRSKGTGFVKFIKKEHAEECIKRSTESPLILDGRRLNVSMALDRKAAEDARTDNFKQKEANDPRNLRLAPVGFIRQGTKEAEEISPADLQKRHQLYSANCAKLRKPVMFVSDTRLSVHNIPPTIDDKKLKEVFLKAVDDKTARITECRVMRDLDRPNAEGVGKSRGYAFVTFKDHKHALAALEKLNNNPDFFSANKRLIIQFSIEDRTVLARKQRCLEKSREHLKSSGGDSEPKPKKNKFWKHKRPKPVVNAEVK